MAKTNIPKKRDLSDDFKALIMELVNGDKDIIKLELRDCEACYKRLRKLLLDHEKNTKEFKKMLFDTIRKPMLEKGLAKTKKDE